MAGNGQYDSVLGQYVPISQDTWADYDASSTGNDWDSWTSWQNNPLLPLTFTTRVIDYGVSTYLNYIVNVETNYPFYTTVYYSDTVDSAGALVSPSSLSVSPSQSLSGIKARYFQFTVSVDRDSAGLDLPYISNITTSLTQEFVSQYMTDINTQDLNYTTITKGSVTEVYYDLPTVTGIGKIVSALLQPQILYDVYVTADYVASGYTDDLRYVPVIALDKSTDPLRIRVLGVNTDSQTSPDIDCVFDAQFQGLAALASDSNGNINQV